MFRTSQRMVRVIVGGLGVMMAGLACSEKDGTPPPKPVVDPFESPTRATKLLLSGSAEYGATVTITGGQNSITTTADPYTAIFRAEISLDTTIPGGATTATTQVALVAKDAAGNASEPTVVEIVYDPLAGPDIDLPVVGVHRINGYYVCQPSGMLTDRADLSDCASRTTPAARFRRGSLVVVTVRAQDERGLAEVEYKAFGTGVSDSDYTLVPAGAYTAGTDYDVSFSFTINAWAGQLSVEAQATDTAGNIANSRAAVLDVTYYLDAGDRTIDVVGAGPMLSSVQDVAVAPDGSVYAANSDAALPAVFGFDPVGQTPFVAIDYFPRTPRALDFDADGNLYAALDNDRIDKTLAGEITHASYQTISNGARGLGMLDGATPAYGYFLAASNPLANDDCLSIQLAGTSRYVVRVRRDATACGGADCNGPISAQPSDCLQSIGTTETAQVAAIATFLNTKTAITGMSAFSSADCANFAPGRGNGVPCVYLVANTKGLAPAPRGSQPVALQSDNGNWSAVEVAHGAADGTMYVAGSNGRVYQVQVAPASTSTNLQTWDFSNNWGLNNPRDVVGVLRRAKTDDGALVTRLFVYVSGSQRVTAFDPARSYAWRLADTTQFGSNNDQLDTPYGIVYVPKDANGGDCLLVANDRPNAGALQSEIFAYTDIDANTADPTPVLPEGSAAMVTGFASVRGIALDMTDADSSKWSLIVADASSQIVVRIGRSASTSDCF